MLTKYVEKWRFKIISPWAFLLCSVMSTVLSCCCGDNPDFERSEAWEPSWTAAKAYSLRRQCERELWGGVIADSCLGMIWKFSFCLLEDTKAVCDVSITSLNLQTQKYSNSALQYLEITVTFQCLIWNIFLKSYWWELWNKWAEWLAKKINKTLKVITGKELLWSWEVLTRVLLPNIATLPALFTRQKADKKKILWIQIVVFDGNW